MLANESRLKSNLNTNTPDGIHHLILSETDNPELAEKARSEATMQLTMARMKQTGSPL